MIFLLKVPYFLNLWGFQLLFSLSLFLSSSPTSHSVYHPSLCLLLFSCIPIGWHKPNGFLCCAVGAEAAAGAAAVAGAGPAPPPDHLRPAHHCRLCGVCGGAGGRLHPTTTPATVLTQRREQPRQG